MCECVDYDRDWYIVVIWFSFGFAFAVSLFCCHKFLCLQCRRVNRRTPTPEPQDDVENQFGDFQTTYEEVDAVAGSETGFEAMGNFTQTVRSESISSVSNQGVVIHNHGESNQTDDCQPSEIELEHIYSSCGALCDKDSSFSQSGIESNDDVYQQGECSEIADYQHPRKQLVNIASDCMVKKDMKQVLPSASETTADLSHPKGQTSGAGDYQYPKTNHEHKSSPKLSPLPKLPDEPTEHTSQVTICLSQELKVEGFTPYTGKSLPSVPTKPLRKVQPSSAEYKTPLPRKSPKYQIPSSKPACLTEYQTPPLVPPRSALPSKPSDRIIEDSSREENYQYPEIDKEFLEHGVATGSTGMSPSTGPHLPTVKSQSTSPVLCIEDSSREENYQYPDIDKEFLKHGIATGSTRISPSTGAKPPKTKSEAIVSSAQRDENYQYPEIDKEFFESGNKEDGCKSSEDRISSSILPNPSPSEIVPPLPPKGKPLSSTTPALYAELNELDREDDDASYEHLTTIK